MKVKVKVTFEHPTNPTLTVEGEGSGTTLPIAVKKGLMAVMKKTKYTHWDTVAILVERSDE